MLQKQTSKILSLLMAVCLVVTMLPLSVFAAGAEPTVDSGGETIAIDGTATPTDPSNSDTAIPDDEQTGNPDGNTAVPGNGDSPLGTSGDIAPQTSIAGTDIEPEPKFAAAPLSEFVPNLQAQNITISYAGDEESVTMHFNDNFDEWDGDLKGSTFTYKVKDARSNVVQSGSADRADDGTTEITLTFGGNTPKVASAYNTNNDSWHLDYLPAYTIELWVQLDSGNSVSTYAFVYITPTPLNLIWLKAPDAVGIGSTAQFKVQAENLAPGYSASYQINNGEKEAFTLNQKDSTSEYTGGFSYSPTTGDAELATVVVTVTSDGVESTITKQINVINATSDHVVVRFMDGLEGVVIDPEEGDEPNVFYGLRESKIAELMGGSAASQEAVYRYVDKMLRPQTLSVTAPYEWGGMILDDMYDDNNQSDYYYLYAKNCDEPITLSWENVSTTFTFTYKSDKLDGKLHGFRLKNSLPNVPVSVKYTKSNGTVVEKDVTPYNEHLFLYEPDGITGEVWMTQDDSNHGYRFAAAYPMSIRPNANLPLLCLTWGANPGSNPSQLYVGTVDMSGEFMAQFSPDNYSNNMTDAVVKYGLVDADGAYIAGTGGSAVVGGDGKFEIPLSGFSQNPGSRLMLERTYTLAGYGSRVRLDTYTFETLNFAFQNRMAITYIAAGTELPGIVGAVALVSAGGQTQEMTSGKTILEGDSIEAHFAAGSKTVTRAELKITDLGPNSGNYSPGEPFTVAGTATPITWGFTGNTYHTLRFEPYSSLTAGHSAQLTMVVTYSDGATFERYLGTAGKPSDAFSAVAIKASLESHNIFHEKHKQIRVSDVTVSYAIGNTRFVNYADKTEIINDEVAKLFDKITVDLAGSSMDNFLNPFTFDVTRQGNEFNIRGYVNLMYMNAAGWVNLHDRVNKDFDYLYRQTKAETDSRDVGYAQGMWGYLAGKAIIGPDGKLTFTFHEGKIFAKSYFKFTPKQQFDLGYYCDWGIAFDGIASSYFSLAVPENGGNPEHPYNFKLVESTSMPINVYTSHDAMKFDIGVYALDIGLHGGISAHFYRNSEYLPYQSGNKAYIYNVYFTTSGDLWAENYNRIKTDIFDFSEVTQRTWHIWDTRGRNTWYGSFTAILPFGVEYGLKITNVNGLGVLGPRADNGWNTYAVNYEFWNQIKGGSPGSSNPSTSSESDDSSARQDSGGSSARQDSGGSSATISAASNIPSPVSTSTATEAATSAVAAAQASGSGTAIANIDNPSEISLAALQAMAAAAGDTPLKLQADSMNGKAVDVRITLDPSRATQGLDLSASTTNASAISSTNLFERFFQNNVMTVALGQQGSFGQPVEIAAKIDPALNMQNLAFYAYDPKANRYARIATPAYWIDQNGYVHFTTELAGHIIISDGELARK